MIQALGKKREDTGITSLLQPVQLVHLPGSRIDLPHDFTVFYTDTGKVTVDNLSLDDVISLAIQDKHPMYAELETCAVEGISSKEDGLTYGKVILLPYDTNEVLRVVITGPRVIPEIEALNARRRFAYYSPEIVRVTMTNGRKAVYRDIDFVTCRANKGLRIAFETQLALPKDAGAAYHALPTQA
ncbi:hypothetical protein HYU17_00010 [Candidatus Woesearchaeota archaeon]|nr:hypothetical protein [Candidatus Woesearchaeota archaeon]